MNQPRQFQRCAVGRWLRTARVFLHDDGGPTAVEYAAMLALIIVGAVSAITALGNEHLRIWQILADATSNVGP